MFKCEYCNQTVTIGVARFSLDHQKGWVLCQNCQLNPRELRDLPYRETFEVNGVEIPTYNLRTKKTTTKEQWLAGRDRYMKLRDESQGREVYKGYNEWKEDQV